MKKIRKSRKIFALLIFIVLAILLSGYTAIASVHIFSDNRLKSGGDIFETEGIEEFNIFKDLRPAFGGEALIKPGSEGTYSFAVENHGSADMEVYFQLFDENTYEIPMAYRLKTGDQYLIGDETTWIAGADLKHYEIKDMLSENTKREYKLDWCWIEGQDAESDARDTWIGNQAAEGKDVTYTLHISLKAEGETEEQGNPNDSVNPEKPSEPEEDVQQVVVTKLKTGDNTNLWFYIRIAAISGLILIILLWKRKQEEGDTK